MLGGENEGILNTDECPLSDQEVDDFQQVLSLNPTFTQRFGEVGERGGFESRVDKAFQHIGA